MQNEGEFAFIVGDDDLGKRFDVVVSDRLEGISRNRAASLIRNGKIFLSDLLKKPGYKVRLGERISGYIPPPERLTLEPESIDIRVVYEDNDIIVIDKQAGMVVHPSPGHASGTLVNALIAYLPELQDIGGVERPGIVHRLDKDTSGLLIVAKHNESHLALSAMFKNRDVYKEYLAVVHGNVIEDEGVILHSIGRHPSDRKKMSINSHKGRQAYTEWEVKDRFTCCSILKCLIKTGRTHQIRVHLSSMQHPVVGDIVYTGGKKNRSTGNRELDSLLYSVPRQMLHAKKMIINHPVTAEKMIFEAPVPLDMESLISGLEQMRSQELLL